MLKSVLRLTLFGLSMVMTWVTDLSDVGGTDEEDTGPSFNCIDYRMTLVTHLNQLKRGIITLGAANNKVILSIGATDLFE